MTLKELSPELSISYDGYQFMTDKIKLHKLLSTLSEDENEAIINKVCSNGK